MIFILTILLTNTVFANVIEEQEYGNDYSDGYVVIKSTPDGGYIAGGYKGISEEQVNSLITKFDNNGEIEWESQSGRQFISEVIDIDITKNNEYIVLERSNNLVQSTMLSGETNYNIKKIDSNKNNVYIVSLQDNFITFNSIAAMEDGGCIIVGKMLIYEENGMQNPGIIIKLNSEGQLEWQKYYKNNSNFSSVQSTKDGGFVVTGGITILDNLGNGTADTIIVKYDKDGNILWEKTYGGSDSEADQRIIETSDNNLILTGCTWSSDIEGIENKGICDAIIAKFDSKGNLLWDASYGGNAIDRFYDVVETSDGKYLAVGTTTSQDIPGITKDDSIDGIMVQYNSEGEMQWHTNYGGDKDELLVGVETNGTEYIAIGCVEDVQRDALVIKFTDFTDYENDNLVINDSIKQNSDSSTYNLNEEKSLSTTDIIVLVVGGIVIIVAIIIAIILIRKVLKY